MRARKPIVEFRWQAYDPTTGVVKKQGIIREDEGKAVKYAQEIVDGIRDLDCEQIRDTPGNTWYGLKVRIVTRTISPWTLHADLEPTETEPTGTRPTAANV